MRSHETEWEQNPIGVIEGYIMKWWGKDGVSIYAGCGNGDGGEEGRTIYMYLQVYIVKCGATMYIGPSNGADMLSNGVGVR